MASLLGRAAVPCCSSRDLCGSNGSVARQHPGVISRHCSVSMRMNGCSRQSAPTRVRRRCAHMRKEVLPVTQANKDTSQSVSQHDANQGRKRNPQRLLLGVDLYYNEKSSMEMCDWVLQHVYTPGDCIVLVHCIVPLPMMDVYSLPDGKLVSNVQIIEMMNVQDAIEEEMTRKLEDFEKRLKHAHPAGVDVESHVLNQKTMYTTLSAALSEKKEIAELMCQAAIDFSADVMFLASNARGGLAEILQGSVAADAVRKASVPVVVYRAAKMRQILSKSSRGFEDQLIHWLEKIGSMYSKKVSTTPAVSAAAGPLYGQVTIAQPGLVSSSDVDSDENLIGQTICEIPGFDAADEEFLRDEADVQINNSASAQRAFLIPVECDSEVSLHAVQWVSETLYRPGDIIVLIHIIPSVPFMVPSMPSMGVATSTLLVAESMTHEFEESSQKLMNETFVPYLKDRGIDYKMEILVELSDGSTEGLGEAIINRAKEWDASAIAIGSHSRGGIGEFFLGSVANYVDHHSPIPVIVIHSNSD